jgi:hypothetical protein
VLFERIEHTQAFFKLWNVIFVFLLPHLKSYI